MTQSKKEFVLLYGDAFVDFISNDRTNTTFTKFLGGTTVNVAAGVARIGAPAALITVTGDDEVSDFVRNEITSEGVRLDYAKIVPEKRVTSVDVHLLEGNERMFTNYIDETPDLQVEADSLVEEAFEKASVFSFCSNTMFHPVALETTKKAVDLAMKHDAIIAMDANIRPLRWESPKQCHDTIAEFLSKADVLKLADEELLFLMEAETIEEGIKKLAAYNISLVMVTVGANGTYLVMNGETRHVPSIKIVCVDTTGAGDAFMSGILRQIHLEGMPTTLDQAFDYVYFANQLGAMAATKSGAITAMPHLKDIQQLIKA